MGLAALAILATTQSLHAQCTGDLNNDQTVDLQDLLTLLVHYGDSCEFWHLLPQLHVSEIHYNPNSAQGNDSDIFPRPTIPTESVALGAGNWPMPWP